MTARVGFGFDSHPLVAGRKLVLGGVEIPFHKGLAGHSDADVLVHSIIEAILGATALGDIGAMFPPEDPRYRDISSLSLLAAVKDLLTHERCKIGNIDATIVIQEPKAAPYLEEMRKNVSRTLGVAQETVSIKAKSSNGLGFPGRGDGIASFSVAIIER